MNAPAWGGFAEVRLLDTEAERISTPCGDGQMAWRKWGGGPPLILLHGGFGSWKHWVRNIRPLSRSFTIYAGDLPGLGDSDAALEPHTAEGLAGIIARGIDELIGADGTFYLGAFSLGAVISSPLICAMGPRVNHAILIGAGGLGDLWQNATTGQRRRSSSMSEEEMRDVVRTNLGFSMIGVRDNIDEDTVTLQLSLLNQDRRLKGIHMSQSGIVMDQLPAILNRVTMVWGELDPYLAPDLDTAIAALRERFEDADIRVIENAGHWTNFEAPESIEEMFFDLIR